MEEKEFPLNEEKIKVLLEMDVEIGEENLRNCILDMALEMFKDVGLVYEKSDILLLPKEELTNRNVIRLDELFRLFGYYYFNKYRDNSNVARNFRKFISKYRIRSINNCPHVRKINMSQKEIEECKKSNSIDVNKNTNLHFIISEKEHNRIFNKNVKNEAGDLYYIYYRTGTPIFTNKEEEYYEICCIEENKLNNEIIKFYNKKDEYELIKKIEMNREKLRNKCKLYRNLESGNYKISNNELLGIGTNLANLKLIDYDEEKKKHEQVGGIHFLDLIDIYRQNWEEDKNFYDKWKYGIKHIESNNYIPSRCEAFCPYYKECNTAGSIIDTLKINNKNRIIRNEKETKFKELDIVRSELKVEHRNSINKCLNNNEETKFLKLIKCQTGIGKTRTTMELLKKCININKRIIYATPTIEAKREFVKLLKENNIRHIMTPDFGEIKEKTLKDKIEHNQKLGMYNTLKDLLNAYLEDESISSEDKEIIENHINFKERWKSYNIVVSTHKMLQYIEYIPTDLVIIDEDYIEKSGYNTASVSFGDLEYLVEKTKFTGNLIKKKINQIETIKYKTLDSIKPIRVGNEKRKKIEEECTNIETKFNVISFLESEMIYLYNPTDNKNDEINSDTIISFMSANDLPNNNIIILSATMNREMYERKYRDTRNIEYIELPKCEYYGNVYQFFKLSYSKNCLEEHEGILDRIKSMHKNIPIITYKKYCSGENEYNFGAINGLNSLQGQDLVVVGTYRRNIVYYLTLAYDIYGKKYDTSDFEVDYMDIERNDFTFKFCTFKDETLRNIELWSVYSEQEQAIGRARLVNPENSNTNVYVYSGYPAEQAKLCIEDPSIIEVDYSIVDD